MMTENRYNWFLENVKTQNWQLLPFLAILAYETILECCSSTIGGAMDFMVARLFGRYES